MYLSFAMKRKYFHLNPKSDDKKTHFFVVDWILVKQTNKHNAQTNGGCKKKILKHFSSNKKVHIYNLLNNYSIVRDYTNFDAEN